MAQPKYETETLDDVALDITTSYINGNYDYVYRAITSYSVREAIALAARVTLMLPPQLQDRFVSMLMIKVT